MAVAGHTDGNIQEQVTASHPAEDEHIQEGVNYAGWEDIGGVLAVAGDDGDVADIVVHVREGEVGIVVAAEQRTEYNEEAAGSGLEDEKGPLLAFVAA